MSKYREQREGFTEGLQATERPAFIEDCHLEYLDELRESGVCNMFGARPYLTETFDELTEKEASAILAYWMKTFPRKPEGAKQ